jgi:hypothetical protein
MQNDISARSPHSTPLYDGTSRESGISAVSWAAIFAGAVSAAALSLILVLLGAGLGFSAISPWSSEGMSAGAITITSAIWIIVMQIIASAIGGFIAGRLRVKWTDVNDDEVYFRDTAHGMLSWALATLVFVGFLGSAMTGLISSGASAAGNVASSMAPIAQGAAQGAAQGEGGNAMSGVVSYYVDSLFRSDQPASDQNPAQMRTESATILLNSLRTGELSSGDKTYLARVVAQRTGISQAEAETRVTDIYNQAKEKIAQAETAAREAADKARKAAAAAALWGFVALLCGAFAASLTAVWGGRRRDAAVLVDRQTVR